MLRTKQNEDYAAEVLRRYDEFRAWAIAHWPNADDPLSSGDFTAGRQELAVLLDARLDGKTVSAPRREVVADDVVDPDAGQFLPVTPAPWP